LTSDAVNVSNATGRTGRAAELLKALAQKGYRRGAATTNVKVLRRSVVVYSPGESAAASSLAAALGELPTQQSASVAPATAVAATGGGRSGPAPTQLSALSGGGIPCVK